MKHLPPLDVHAHVDPSIDADDLVRLGAVVFAVTRSVDDFMTTLDRRDRITVWGVGCHPGLVGVQRSFDSSAFAAAIASTPLVGEVGLDGSSRVPLGTQIETLEAILEQATNVPRVVSLHSFKATGETLAVIGRHRATTVLHWWLGDEAETRRAMDLGCYFSVNQSMTKRYEHLALLPLDRVLTETDHPSGDRFSPIPRQPGRVQPVEERLAALHGCRPEEVRNQAWRNLATLVNSLPGNTEALFPAAIRQMLGATLDGTAH
jgi:TatD DNase family protein